MVNKDAHYQLMDLMQEMIIIISESGQVIYANPLARAEFGWLNDSHMHELGIEGIFPSLFRMKGDIKSILEENTAIKLEIAAYRRNQTCFDSQLVIYALPGKASEYLCSITNIHTVKELRREVEKANHDIIKANKVRNEFVANVTHELRTPVNGIKGNVKYLLESSDLEQEARSTMKIVEHCCDNMERIINNLLDFSKMEAGKFSIEESEFSLQECVKQVVDTNIKQASEKGIDFEASIGEGIPERLLGDELRISQILNNLVSNAIKFTSIGKVKLEIIKTAQFENEIVLFIMVIDTGIGIAKEERDKLFKSFSQVDGSITRRFGGTGLGLSVTKTLIEMMGGSINVESSPGKGSTFTCSIMLHTLEEEASYVIEKGKLTKPDMTTLLLASNEMNVEKIYQFGTKENLNEIQKNMEKLVLCMEMRTWHKAEEFANNLNQLVKGGNQDIIRQAFRLGLSVRKEDYHKSIDSYEQFREMMPSIAH